MSNELYSLTMRLLPSLIALAILMTPLDALAMRSTTLLPTKRAIKHHALTEEGRTVPYRGRRSAPTSLVRQNANTVRSLYFQTYRRSIPERRQQFLKLTSKNLPPTLVRTGGNTQRRQQFLKLYSQTLPPELIRSGGDRDRPSIRAIKAGRR